MGRVRTERVDLHLTVEEKRYWKAEAESAGLSLTGFIHREVLKCCPPRYGPFLSDVAVLEDTSAPEEVPYVEPVHVPVLCAACARLKRVFGRPAVVGCQNCRF